MAEAAPATVVAEEAKVEPKSEVAVDEKIEGDAKKEEKTEKSKSGGKGGKPRMDGHRLNVKNLSADTTTEELKKCFEPFGTVVAAEVKFKDDGKSRGFGFVVFSSEDDSKKATAELHDREVAGKKLIVGPAERREDDGKKGKGDGKGSHSRSPSGPFGGGGGFRLNVKNMAWDITAEKLRELFAPFGEVSDAQVKLKESGKSRGFGFVVLPTEEAAKKAIAEMHDKEVEGKKLNVAPAERRIDEDGAATHGMVFPTGKGMSKKDAESFQAAYMQQMMFMQNQAAMMAWGASPYGGQKEYDGVLSRVLAPGRHQRHKKDDEAAKSHGFITCAETHALYGADIYADRSVLPKDAEVGSKLKFTVIANYGEHPKAATAKLVAA